MVGFRAKAIRRGVSFPSRFFCYSPISPSQKRWKYSVRAWEEVTVSTLCRTSKKWAPSLALRGVDTQATLHWR